MFLRLTGPEDAEGKFTVSIFPIVFIGKHNPPGSEYLTYGL
jgi:hypothetical protein